jgi:hypothetical protein
VSTTPDSPIYAQLVHERGDVPEQARRIAEQAWREVRQTLDFHLPVHDRLPAQDPLHNPVNADDVPPGTGRRRA